MSLITQDHKDQLIHEFSVLMQQIEDTDQDEINNKLADIIRNVRKTYAVSRDND